jgi:hypothetical protein
LKARPHKPPKPPAPTLLGVFRKGWFTNTVWICICSITVLSFFLVPAKPRTKIAISYVGQTNMAGQSVAFFVITNTGGYTAITYHTGSIEIEGSNETEPVNCETVQPALRPGGTDTVKVLLPAAMYNRWRFTIGYSREGPSSAKTFLTSEWIN